MKKLTSILLVLILVFSCVSTVGAAQKNFIADMAIEFGEGYTKVSQTEKELIYANSDIGMSEVYLLYVKDYLKGSGIEVTTNNNELLLADFAERMVTEEIYSEMISSDLGIGATCTLEGMDISTFKNGNGVEVSTKGYYANFNLADGTKGMMMVFISLVRNGDDLYIFNVNIMTDFNNRIKKYNDVLNSIALTFKDPVINTGAQTPAQQPIKIVLNGEELYLDSAPVIVNDRTLVPVRGIFEKLGYNVWWNAEARKVGISNNITTLGITIDSMEMAKETYDPATSAMLSSEVLYLDVPATIMSDRTYLPLRAVSEAIGCEVSWDGANRTVIINSK